MHCFVYKSRSKSDTYVYLRDRENFECLPASVRESLGALVLVMDIELSPERKLARESALVVIDHLHRSGFHLQFPPPLVPAD
jgi:uncharacterized protein YcgL (UPF0745 family)